jgi:hypothetical protein
MAQVPRRRIQFDASKPFPKIDSGIVYSISFDTCKDVDLRITLIKINSNSVADGFVADGWWKIWTPELPERYVRLSRGLTSIKRLILNYGFMDDRSCVHYRNGSLHVTQQLTDIAEKSPNVPRDAHAIGGIPQREVNSGICWWAATCHAFFYPHEMRKLFTSRLPDENMKQLVEKALESPEASEKLRERWWNEYAFGDRFGQPPHLDGQNGMSQFCIMMSKLDIPVLRFFIDGDNTVELTDPVKDQNGMVCPLRTKRKTRGEPRVLAVRFYRGNHQDKYIPPRILEHDGQSFALTSILMGSMDCGHQIGAAVRRVYADHSKAASRDSARYTGARANNHPILWRRWAIADADASRYGISPMHFHIQDKASDQVQNFWRYWRFMVPVTMFGSQRMCDLSPQNHPTKSLERLQHKFQGAASETVGDLNADFIYLSLPSTK